MILDTFDGHAVMYTGGNRPITHAAFNNASVVLSQRTKSYGENHLGFGKTHNHLKVFRMGTGNAQAADAAAKIAKGFSTERDGPGHKAPEAQTPFSDRRLEKIGPELHEWTQASAFRAARALLRSKESGVPLSKNEGTTCGSFVATTLQAAIIQQAMADGTMPAEAKAAIENIKERGLHLPEVTHSQFEQDKAARYALVGEGASKQIKDLMPAALQLNAKTTSFDVLRLRMEEKDSGFEHVGFANPHPDGVQVLPKEHPDVRKELTNKPVE